MCKRIIYDYLPENMNRTCHLFVRIVNHFVQKLKVILWRRKKCLKSRKEEESTLLTYLYWSVCVCVCVWLQCPPSSVIVLQWLFVELVQFEDLSVRHYSRRIFLLTPHKSFELCYCKCKRIYCYFYYSTLSSPRELLLITNDSLRLQAKCSGGSIAKQKLEMLVDFDTARQSVMTSKIIIWPFQ